MKKIISKIFIGLLCTSSLVFANSSEVHKEDKRDLFRKMVELQVSFDMVENSDYWDEDKELNSMTFVDILWDKGWDSDKKEDLELVQSSLSKIDFSKYEIADQLRLFLLDQKFNQSLVNNSELMNNTYQNLISGKADRRVLYTLLNYKDELEGLGFEQIYNEVEDNYFDDLSYYKTAEDAKEEELSAEVVKDLFYNNPDLRTYRQGRYVKGAKLYMFCRKDRNYPCRMIMRNSENEIVRNDDGTIWTSGALGLARLGRPYNVKNGYTPAGVYTMDSVMPQTNNQRVFGKFRRVILNFIPRTKNESQMKKLLPDSSYNESWWKQAVVARDVGRSLLRIHGTGLRNYNPASSYYPYVKTAGCIAQRENTYGSNTYKDQRHLLDELMKASSYKPIYKNETRVKGILYVIEINNDKKAVEADELQDLLEI